jgi:hypothetical protein
VVKNRKTHPKLVPHYVHIINKVWCIIWIYPCLFVTLYRTSLLYGRHYRSKDLNVKLTWVFFCNTLVRVETWFYLNSVGFQKHYHTRFPTSPSHPVATLCCCWSGIVKLIWFGFIARLSQWGGRGSFAYPWQ